MAIKNIAPATLTAVKVGGIGPDDHGVGTMHQSHDGKMYIKAKIIPGTGSVTGHKQSLVVPYYTGDAHTAGEFTHDLTDCPTNSQQLAGVQMFSMMTAVTHYGWVQVRGEVQFSGATTNPLWLDGVNLIVATTDNQLTPKALTATTFSEIYLRVGLAEANNTALTASSVSIRLLGEGYE
jgi:hypothetical protein